MDTKNQNLVKKEDICTQVLEKVKIFEQTGQLKIPNDYSPENALKSAYIILSDLKNKDGKPILEICSKESIAKSLLKMVVLGLSPLKKQGDFIVYGNQLTFQEEYTGNIALAKRYGMLKNIKANAIFQGDIFEFIINSYGRKIVIKHEQKLENIGGEVIGAYAVMEMDDGSLNAEIMSISQIKSSWNQGSMKGQSGAHKNFSDQMAIKTVINRACKLLIRSSNDSIFIDNEEKDVAIDARENQINYTENKIQEIEIIDVIENKNDFYEENDFEKIIDESEKNNAEILF